MAAPVALRHPAPCAPRQGDGEDRQLIRRIAAKDRQAFEQLYHRYAGRLGAYLQRFLCQPEQVEETLNDVLLAVWQSAGRFDHSVRLSTWLYAITHKKALVALRSARRHSEVRSFDGPDGDGADGAVAAPQADNPEHHTLCRETLGVLAEGLATLSSEHREVVELTVFAGCSYAEIAAITDCPVSTVKTRMFYARKHLTRFMLDAGQEPSTYWLTEVK